MDWNLTREMFNINRYIEYGNDFFLRPGGSAKVWTKYHSTRCNQFRSVTAFGGRTSSLENSYRACP